jgi:mannose-1-phosphate guanylyltransferase
MFVFSAAALLEEAKLQIPEILDGVRASLPDVRDGTLVLDHAFSTVRSISVDHAILENAKNVSVVPLDAGWSDIGSWQTVWEASEHDGDGNALIGEVVALDVRGSYLRAGSRMIAIAGMDDVVVVETPEVILIVPKDRSQLVRDLAARAEKTRRSD